MRTLIAAAILFVSAMAIDAKPDKPAPPKSEQKKAAPVIVSGMTNWGNLQRSGNVLKIEGNIFWEALGEIRSDGRVYLLWTKKSTNEPCPGVYAIKTNGELHGHWGYGGRCSVNDKGDLVGVTYSERIHSVEPPVPGF